MRITKAALHRRCIIATVLALAALAVLAILDTRLRAQSGFDIKELQGFTLAWQYQAAARAWLHGPFGLLAGFLFGFDYLFMLFYAASFFYASIIVREAFASPSSRLYRLLTILAAVPIAGGLLDACENVLEMWILLNGGGDALARVAFSVSNAKMVAGYVGLTLLVGAILTLVQERQKHRLTLP